MQLNDIIIVTFMVSDAYTISDTDPIPPKMADTDISIWYRCVPNILLNSKDLNNTDMPFMRHMILLVLYMPPQVTVVVSSTVNVEKKLRSAAP